jgi:acetyl-CoA C-acetyltransferase
MLKYTQVEQINHVHTPGNSSGIVDGAALTLVGSKEMGNKLGLKARARIVSAAVTSADPTIMLTGPAYSARKALQIAGMSPKDIDIYEMNEAFASAVLKFQRELEIDDNILNVNGGAIAMGHPLGATGSILISTVLDELERTNKSTGLITLCVGGGMGVATIIERV